jgi:hypothetical protein
MDWYGRKRKIVRATALLNLAGFHAALAVRFERVKVV